MANCTKIEIPDVTRAKKSCNECQKQRIEQVKPKPGGNDFKWKYVRSIWRIGREDPRRGIHSLKAGLALVVVSLFYLINPLFDVFGRDCIWAVLTVALVFEFTAGATLSKGLNRGAGTLVAGSLAVGVEYIAEHAGRIGQPIIIALSVFIFGAATTFCRFFPWIKRKYDYGALIFILTFNLITVSGYRAENILHEAYLRLATIGVGCGVCLVISLFVYPIWAGQDLHYLLIRNLQRLADSLQGSVEEYFEGFRHCGHLIRSQQDPIFSGYQAVLESKLTEVSLANFASWEPMHGPFGFKYPWKQYLKIGSMLRHSAYSVVALHDCLLSEIQAPNSLRAQLKVPCMRIGTEARIVLLELAQNIKDMRRNRPLALILENLTSAMEDLQASMRAQPELFIDTKKWSIVEEVMKDDNSEGNPDVPMHLPHEKPNEAYTDPEVPRGVEDGRFRRYLSLPVEVAGSMNSPQRTVNYRLKESKHTVAFLEALPLATFASLLMEIAARLEHLIVAVDELGKLANFKPAILSQHREQQLQLKSGDVPDGCTHDNVAAE